jgi:hypothetical protein
MRKMIIATAASLLVGGAGVLALATPAFAAGTPVTVTINAGGGLGISAPVGPVSLGTATASASAQTVTGSLGPVLVTDLRAGILGWVATAGSTDFTGPAGGGPTISAATMTYTPGTAVVVGIATVTPTSLTAMGTPGTVQTATAVIGVNTATWNPSIVVPIPAGAVAGSYGATITHSVS